MVKLTTAWLKYLPATLRARVEHRPNLQKALINTGWLFGDKVLRMGVGLLVGVWVARYLGPEQFGLLNYAMAIVALFGAVASLGLNGIVVRDLVMEPKTANETLGTTLLLQAIGGLLAFGLAVLAISFARPNDSLAKLLVAVLGFVMVFKCTDVVRYWFESQVKSKYVVWLENGIFLVLAVVKVGLILMEASLMAFVWAAFAESVLVAVGLLGVFARRGGALSAWRISYDRAKRLLKNSWPLILSGLAVMVYMRIDQIMLGQMLGDEAVGVYSAAVRISEVWYFIPTAIIASVFPAIVAAKKHSETLYRQRLQNLYNA
ncbi:MAG: O-unit flippase, partial [Hydrogenophilales bacterium 28-61-11]